MSLGFSRSVAAVLLLLAPSAGFAASEASHRSWKTQWIVSAVTLAAASFADASTSVGRYEQNPLLRGAEGRFSLGRGLALKSGTAGGVLLIEALFGRKHPQIYEGAAITNFAMTGAFAAAADKNAHQK